ncbi:MAG: antibiotic biosynthesis monooxygenase [Haloferacaceae archaeon]
MFVVANRIPVADGHGEAFEERFRARAGEIEDRPGFVSLDVLRPVDADRYVVLTYWESEADFEAWTDSDAFREAHADSPPSEMFDGHPDLETHEVVLHAD